MESEAYTQFAEVYDLFMDNVAYDQWSGYLVKKLRELGIHEGIVCELGCGTGSMTELLAEAGYDMIGIDGSPEMLEIALEKKLASGYDILYLLQDMRAFELYGTVRAVVSVCDSLNYLLEPGDLRQTFRLVNNYLDPGGYFIFDMNTPARYEAIGDCTIAENRDEGSFIWENLYDPETKINEYLLTLFLPEEAERAVGAPGREADIQGEGQEVLYRKAEELHTQRAYTSREVKELLEEAGLEFVGAWEAYTEISASEEAERILYIARECMK
ncbi:MAG: class I SAM-dependent methyltransferase [Eubacterium sp.]|nr:class I SAM-dependent methyltransferase [Eubacterium sp.]